jgi:hypothetical protein
LLVSVSAKETGLGELHRLHPDLPKVLDGYKSVEDWGISMVGERRFRLYLLHTGTEPIPLMTTIIVTINNRNHVKVESCKRNQQKQLGTHSVVWNGNDNNGNQVSSGIYFARIIADEKSLTTKMLMLK